MAPNTRLQNFVLSFASFLRRGSMSFPLVVAMTTILAGDVVATPLFARQVRRET